MDISRPVQSARCMTLIQLKASRVRHVDDYVIPSSETFTTVIITLKMEAERSSEAFWYHTTTLYGVTIQKTSA
jgi:hypothetical protein